MESTPFSQSQMARRQLLLFEEQDGFWLISSEDLILQKLLWRRGSKSEKQWRDVLGVLKVQALELDYVYLLEWADALEILEPFNQALLEAGGISTDDLTNSVLANRLALQFLEDDDTPLSTLLVDRETSLRSVPE
jgi:hypothetical protein